jgi:hypothetical protein
MSLKAVHLIFVTALSALCFGVGVWKVRDFYSNGGGGADLLFGVGAFLCGAVVIYYGRYFLRKLKSTGYL